MADEKLNTGPAENTSPEAAGPIATPEQAAASEPRQEHTGPTISSDADFNARTKEQEALKAELEKAGITTGSGSFEQGDPNYRDDSLDAYTEFGVSYDKSSNHWMYGEKPIYILYDKEHYTFCDKGVSDGVSLNVVRDKAGNIENLVSVDKGELEQFVK